MKSQWSLWSHWGVNKVAWGAKLFLGPCYGLGLLWLFLSTILNKQLRCLCFLVALTYPPTTSLPAPPHLPMPLYRTVVILQKVFKNLSKTSVYVYIHSYVHILDTDIHIYVRTWLLRMYTIYVHKMIAAISNLIFNYVGM